MNLPEAEALAAEIFTALSPFCHRCEIAGSVRRKKSSDIKDVEVVILPKPECARELEFIINRRWGIPSLGKWPAKYTKIRSRHNIDIFTCTNPDAWGLLFTIRTGPAPFCERLLAFWKTVTNGGFSKDCILRLADGTTVPCREERDVFAVLEQYGKRPCPWITPEKRMATKH